MVILERILSTYEKSLQVGSTPCDAGSSLIRLAFPMSLDSVISLAPDLISCNVLYRLIAADRLYRAASVCRRLNRLGLCKRTL